MGDVAMAVPVLKELLAHYPSLEITLLSNKNFEAFFEGIDRLHFFAADLKGEHKGIAGLFRLFTQLKKLHSFTAIADLHNVLRSAILCSFFRLAAVHVKQIDKGRKEKKELVRKEQKIFRQLKTSHQRYADVFAALGFPITLQNRIDAKQKQNLSAGVQSFLLSCKEKKIIIAPFAKHAEKMYPLEKMKQVIMLLVQENFSIILLGAAGEERFLLDEWAAQMQHVFSAAGKFSLEEEMQIISASDLLISMDSANMHIAAFLGVPVISVWGATHPYAGFMGYGLDKSSAVQIDLSCRPCSVFGNKPCWRGDHACMQGIEENMIVNKAKKMLA